MKKETLKLNRSALSFTDHDSFSKINPATEGKPRTLKMVAYSGKIIKNHWYWGDLAIDTSGMKMAKKEIPIGRPWTYPAGTVMFGYPATAEAEE
mgnify:CR=1 FL=1